MSDLNLITMAKGTLGKRSQFLYWQKPGHMTDLGDAIHYYRMTTKISGETSIRSLEGEGRYSIIVKALLHRAKSSR